MSPRRISQAFAILFATTTFSALIADEFPKSTDTARPPRIAGKKVAKVQVPKVRTLYGLDWHGSLASAQQAATPQEEKPGRPVFWLRMLVGKAVTFFGSTGSEGQRRPSATKPRQTIKENAARKTR